MRSFLIASALFVSAVPSEATSSPFLQLKQATENVNVQFVGKKTSGQPAVAYVGVADQPNHRSVWHGVYSGRDSLAAGQIVNLGKLPATVDADHINTFVNYVRLAEGTNLGKSTADEAKQIAASFQQH